MESLKMEKQVIKTNPFGKTGALVTRVGLGGEGVLRTTRRTEEARAVIKSAILFGHHLL